jgi:hypothetical protein
MLRLRTLHSQLSLLETAMAAELPQSLCQIKQNSEIPQIRGMIFGIPIFAFVAYRLKAA